MAVPPVGPGMTFRQAQEGSRIFDRRIGRSCPSMNAMSASRFRVGRTVITTLALLSGLGMVTVPMIAA